MSVPNILNPFKDEGVDLYVAIAYHLPYESIKFLTVLGLLEGAEAAGKLVGVHTLVEATSGNTGVPLTAMARSYGLKVKLVVSNDLPDGKRYPLIMAGADLISPEEDLSGIGTARKLGKRKGVHNLDQYGNIDGTVFHELFTAPKILEQLPCKPTVAVLGVGTGGNLVGVSRYFRRVLENITMAGVLLAPQQEIPGVRDRNRMTEITLPWQAAMDESVEIPTRPSYLASEWFNWTMGITPGGSGGFAYLGALKLLQNHKMSGTLDSLRDRNERIPVVILFPDGNRPYGDRFMANLPTEFLDLSKAPLPWQFPGYEIF
jgi:cysteine synthase B